MNDLQSESGHISQWGALLAGRLGLNAFTSFGLNGVKSCILAIFLIVKRSSNTTVCNYVG